MKNLLGRKKYLNRKVLLFVLSLLMSFSVVFNVVSAEETNEVSNNDTHDNLGTSQNTIPKPDEIEYYFSVSSTQGSSVVGENNNTSSNSTSTSSNVLKTETSSSDKNESSSSINNDNNVVPATTDSDNKDNVESSGSEKKKNSFSDENTTKNETNNSDTKTVDKETVVVSMPAQTFKKTFNHITVTVEAPEGVFPEGTRMVVNGFSKETIIQEANKLLNNNVVDAISIDISFYDSLGNEIEPTSAKKVHIHISSTDSITGSEFKIFHIDNNGIAKIVGDASSSDADFKSVGFSVYAIVGTEGAIEVEYRRTYIFRYQNENGDYIDWRSQVVKNGEKLYDPGVPYSPNNTSYFHEWRLGATHDDNESSVTPRFNETISGITSDETVYYHAHYNVKYAAIFWNRDKTDVIDAAEITSSTTSINLSSIQPVVPENYVHVGWVLLASNGNDTSTTYATDGTVSISELKNIELRAIVEEGSKISFNGNGEGASFTAPIMVIKNTTPSAPANPTRNGYNFNGWYTSKAAADSSNSSYQYNFDTPVSSNMTLYAGWTARNDVPYTVYVYAERIENGVSEYALVKVLDDGTYTADQILDWNATQRSTVEETKLKQSSTSSPDFDYRYYNYNTALSSGPIVVKADGSTSFKVYYDLKEFTIKFVPGSNNSNGNITAQGVNQGRTYEFTTKLGQDISTLWPTGVSSYNRSGSTYTFYGWDHPYIDSNYVSKRLVASKQLVSDSDVSSTEITYTALYLTNAHIISLTYYFEEPEITLSQCNAMNNGNCIERNGKIYRENTSYTETVSSSGTNFGQKEIDGYSGVGRTFSTSHTGDYCKTSDNCYFNFFYDRSYQNLVYRNGNQTTQELLIYGAVVDDATYNITPDKTAAGVPSYMEFKGWYTDETYSDLYQFGNNMPTHDVTLYALYEPVDVTITILPQNGSAQTTVTIPAGTKVSRVEDPTRTNYEFAYWADENGVPVNFEDRVFVNDATIKAIWTTEEEFHIVYSTEYPSDTAPVDNSSYRINSHVQLKSLTESFKETLKFLGWRIKGHEDAGIFENGYLFQIEDKNYATCETEYSCTIEFEAYYQEVTPVRTTIVYKPNYENASSDGNSDVTDSGIIQNNTVTPRGADTFNRPGYTLVYWNTKADGSGLKVTFNSAFAVDADVYTGEAENYLYAIWEPNTDTPYVTEHYLENTDGTFGSYEDRISGTGTTDTTVEAVPRIYTGFTLDKTVLGTVDSGVITVDRDGNGTLVLKLYYTRDQYQVSYEYTGNVPSGAADLPGSTQVRQGATVTVADKPSVPGYTFNGWNKDGSVTSEFTMPMNDVTLTGSFTANTNTKYKTIYYLEQLDGSFLPVDEVTLTGTTDTLVNAVEREYDGYSLDKTIEGTKASGIVTGDENLVLTLYYKLNEYHVTYAYTGDASYTRPALPVDNNSYKYTQNVTILPDLELTGYTFNGWYTYDAIDSEGHKVTVNDTEFRMPSRDVVLYASFTENTDTPYRVIHYVEAPTDTTTCDKEVNGKCYIINHEELDNGQPLTGTTNSEVSRGNTHITGFTFDADTTEAQKAEDVTATTTGSGLTLYANIRPDGSLVLEFFYNRNKHDITYRVIGTIPSNYTGNIVTTIEDQEYGKDEVLIDNPTAEGFTFGGWYLASTSTAVDLNGTQFTMPDGDVVFYGQFSPTPDDSIYYIYEYHEVLEENIGEYPEDEIVHLGSQYYHLVITLKSDQTAHSEVNYPVSHEAGYVLNKDRTLNDERNTRVVTIYEYEINPSSGEIESNPIPIQTEFIYDGDNIVNIKGTVIANKSDPLIIAAYYDLDEFEVNYSYVSDATYTRPPLPIDSNKYKYTQNVTIKPDQVMEGYTFVGWYTHNIIDSEGNKVEADDTEFIMPSRNVTLYGYFTENTDTRYRVIHYIEAIEGTTTCEYPINGKCYVISYEELNKGQPLTATTNSEVSRGNTYIEGFTFDADVTMNNNQDDVTATSTSGSVTLKGRVRADGSLELRFFYNRNTHKVNYVITGHKPTTLDTTTVPVGYTVYQFGNTVTVEPDAVAPGYTFSGWDTHDGILNGNTSFEMPDDDVTLYGSFTPVSNIAHYNVIVYEEILDTTGLSSDEYIEKDGKTYKITKDLNKEYEVLKWVDYQANPKEGYVVNYDLTASDEDNALPREETTYDDYGNPHTSDITNKVRYVDGKLTVSGYVLGDDSLTMAMYYDLDSHKVIYSYYGTVPTNAPVVPAEENYKVTSSVTVAPVPYVEGYTFNGWTTSVSITDGTFVMPNQNVELTGTFVPNSDTEYKVIRYLETLNDSDPYDKAVTVDGVEKHFVKVSTETKTGNTDSEGNANSVVSNNGMVFNSDYTLANITNPTIRHEFNSTGELTLYGNIDGNGSLELEFFYDRNTFKVNYDIEGHVPIDLAEDAVPSGYQEYRYGEEVTVAPDAFAEGYTFTGWYSKNNLDNGNPLDVDATSFVMPARDLTLYGRFTPTGDSAKYIIREYTQILSLDELGSGESYITIGDKIYKIKSTSDFGTPLNWSPITINQKDGYVINNELTENDEDNNRNNELYVDGELVKTEIIKSGDTITGIKGFLLGGRTLVMAYYYDLAEYQVIYEYTGTVPSNVSSLPGTETHLYTEKVTVAPNATAEGYTFSGWTVSNASVTNNEFNMPAGTVYIRGSFTPANNTYHVRHYFEVVDPIDGVEYVTVPGSSIKYEIVDTDSYDSTRNGITGSTAEANNISIDGLVFNKDDTLRNIDGTSIVPTESGDNLTLRDSIAPDGSTVFEFFYTRVPYEVEYIINGHIPTILDPTTYPGITEHKYGETVTVEPDAIAPGYTFSGWTTSIPITDGTFEMPHHKVTLYGQFTPTPNSADYVINVYTEILDLNDLRPGQTYITKGEGENKKNYKIDTISGKGTPLEWVNQAIPSINGYVLNKEYTLDDADNAANYNLVVDGEDVSTYAGYTGENLTSINGYLLASRTLVMSYYYDLQEYEVTYVYTGTAPDGTLEQLPASSKHKYTEVFDVAGNPSAVGYKFSNWHARGDDVSIVNGTITMPARDISIQGSFTPLATTYTITYYEECLSTETCEKNVTYTDDSGNEVTKSYKVRATITRDGVVANPGTANSLNNFVGLTIDKDVTESNAVKNSQDYVDNGDTVKLTGTIFVDENDNPTLYLDFFYYRNEYLVDYVITGHIPTTLVPETYPEEETHVYGESVTVKPQAQAAGYRFVGWTTADGSTLDISSGSFDMPDRPVTLYGHFAAINDASKYKVKIYKETQDSNYDISYGGKNYKLTETEYPGTALNWTNYPVNGGAGYVSNDDAIRADIDNNKEVIVDGEDYSNRYILDADGNIVQVSGYVLADDSLIIAIYYDLMDYTVTYEYTGTVPAGAMEQLPSVSTHKYTEVVDIASDPEVFGYTFDGWRLRGTDVSIVDGHLVMPARDVIIRGSFSAKDTSYSVIHYVECLNNETCTKSVTYTDESGNEVTKTYKVISSETNASKYNQNASANSVNDFTGLEINKNATSANAELNGNNYSDNDSYVTVSGTVGIDSEDQPTLDLEFFYSREENPVKYVITGHIPTTLVQDTYPGEETHVYGESVTVKPQAQATGYRFIGWTTSDGSTLDISGGTFDMPDRPVTLYGRFEAIEDASSYKVKVYRETLDSSYDVTVGGKNYKLIEADYSGTAFNWTSVPVAGGVGYITNNDAIRNDEFNKKEIIIDGTNYSNKYTVNSNGDITSIDGFILAEDSLVISVYYDLADYEVIYEYTGNVPAGAMEKLPESERHQYTEVFDVADSVSVPGYTFSGWNVQRDDIEIVDGKLEMPARTVILRGSFTANDTTYRVTHYVECLNTETCTKSVTYTDESGNEVTKYYKVNGTNGTYTRASKTGRTVYAVDSVISGLSTNKDATIARADEMGNNHNLLGTQVQLSGEVTVDENGDPTREFEFFYTRNIYRVHYQYEGDVPAQAVSQLPSSHDFAYGETVNIEPDAKVPGYRFIGWHTDDETLSVVDTDSIFVMPSNNVTLIGRFVAYNDVKYEIRHYLENLDGTYAEPSLSNHTIEIKNDGVTDSTVTAEPGSFDGFTFDRDNINNVISGTVTVDEDGNGTLVLKLYYSRDSYNVSYEYVGTVPENTPDVPESSTYKYQENVTVEDVPSVPGYEFLGWSYNGEIVIEFIMPDEDTTLVGMFRAKTDTIYHVEYYLENLDGEFSLHESDTLTGTTDTVVSAEERVYDGFTLDKSIDGTLVQSTVNGDGSTTLKLYYTRKAHTVTYEYLNGVPDNAPALPSDETYKYEEEVTVADKPNVAGYEFVGWAFNGEIVTEFNMPNDDVTLVGLYTTNTDTQYKVEYYLQNLDGTFSLTETNLLAGATGSSVTAAEKDFVGFTLDKNITGTNATDTIKGDGSTVLRLYYNRNTYRVVYSYEGSTIPEGALVYIPQIRDYKYGEVVTVSPDVSINKYTFNGWHSREYGINDNDATFLMPAANITLYGYFEKGGNTGSGSCCCDVCDPCAAKGIVIVHYVDEDTNSIILEDVKFEGRIETEDYPAERYSTSQKIIDGYEYQRVVGNTSGEFKEETQEVTYYYKKKPTGIVIAKYVDTNNYVLYPRITTNGYVGEEYSTEQLYISGYEIESIDGAVSGTYKDGTIIVTYVYKKIVTPEVKTGTVIARYLDTEGYTISPRVTINGKEGDSYLTEQLLIPGYEISSVEGATTGTIVEGTKFVTYIYKKVVTPVQKTGTVIVKYIDEDGYTLSPRVTITGNVDDAYTTDQLAISGYEISSVEGTTTGTIVEGTRFVTYIYKKVVTPVQKTGTVIVKYIDEDGYTLSPRVTITGNVDDAYTTDQLAISGYEISSIEGATTGSIAEGTTIVTYVYKKIVEPVVEPEPVKEEGILVVHYIDRDGNALVEDDITTKLEGTKYVTSQKIIPGYKFVSASDNTTGVYTKETIEVTYTYELIPTPATPVIKTGEVIARYVDEDGYTLVPRVTISGNVDDRYLTEQLIIPGYEISSVEGSTTGSIVEGTTIVTYVYKKIVEPVVEPEPVKEEGILVVHYIDRDGNALVEDDITTKLEGTKYVTSQKIIPGYKFVSASDNTTGVYTKETIEVTYTYELIPVPVTPEVKTGSVIVRYVSEDGYTLSPKVTITGNVDDTYTTDQLVISGYEIDSIDGNTTGTIAEGTTIVTYVYKKIVEPVVEPEPEKEEGILVVHYVDKDGNALVEDDITTKLEGTKYVTSQKIIPGYKFVSASDNTTGVYTKETIEVTYTYELIPVEVTPEVKTGSVIVRYIDNEGYTLLPSIIINGKVNDNYLTEQIMISGYRFNSVDGDVTGNIIEGTKYVTYLYEKIKNGTVIAHYYDENGNAISDDVILTGESGTSYAAPIKSIDGYTLSNIEKIDHKPVLRLMLKSAAPAINGNNIGVFTDDTIEVVFTYIKNEVEEAAKYGFVVVSYEDNKGNPLKDDEVLNGLVGTNYITIKKQITGYTLSSIVGDRVGSFKDGIIEVIYVYDKIQEPVVDPEPVKEEGILVVHYIDRAGNALVEDDITTKLEGTKYVTSQKIIPGYKFVSASDNITGVYTKETIEVTYTYEQLPVPVTPEVKTGSVVVRYLDNDGYTLSSSVTINGNVGNSYLTEQLLIPGYEIYSIDGSTSGIIAEGTKFVTYVYKKVVTPVQKTGTVIVKYVSEDGYTLSPSVTIIGNVDDAYTTDQLVIPGYEISSIDGRTSGTIVEGTRYVTYVYKKNVAPVQKTGNIIVKYVSEDGYTLSPSVTITGKVGETYTTDQLVISGYDIKSIDGSTTGSIIEGTTIVTYVYKKVAVPVVEPEPVKEEGILVVHYVDKDGNALVEDVITTKLEGTKYVTSQKIIPGYKFVSATENTTGVYTKDTIEVTYTYEVLPVEITPEAKYGYIIVHYETEYGNPVADDSISSGAVGSNYFVGKKAIPGYEFIKFTPNDVALNGQYIDGVIEITALYKKLPEETSSSCCGCGVVTCGTCCNTCIPTPTVEKYGIVLTHYQDESGKMIANDSNQTGKVDTAYVTNSKEINGYELIRVEGPRVGTYKDTVIEVTYVYRKIADGSTQEPESKKEEGILVVHYVDKDGNILSDDIVTTKLEGTKYVTSKKAIPGYKFVSDTGNTTGVYTKDTIEVTYVYEKLPDDTKPVVDPEPKTGSVLVRYIDTEGYTLSPSITVTGNVDEEYSTEQLKINGYTIDSIEGNTKGTFIEGKQTVTYIYKKVEETTKPEIKVGKVIARYVTTDGYSLVPMVVFNDKVDETYLTEQLIIPGYEYVSITGESTGKFIDGTIYVTYLYKKVEDPVVDPTPKKEEGILVVHYVDKDGNILSDDIVTTRLEGTKYVTSKIAIPEYKFVSDTGNTTGVYTNDIVEVTYTYEKLPKETVPEVKTGKVIVRYIDTDNNVLFPTMTIKDRVGEGYETDQLYFNGYSIKSVDGNTSGEIKEETTTVTYIYQKKAEPTTPEVKTGKVIVRYIDTDGNAIYPHLTIKDTVGEDYETDQLVINGYEFVSLDGIPNGKITSDTITVTYIYKVKEQTCPCCCDKEEEDKYGDLLVHYIDVTGKTIATSSSDSGKVGEGYTTIKKVIDGYEFIYSLGEITGKYKEGTTVVYYVYKLKETTPVPTPKSGKVIVKYITTKGVELTNSITLTGNIGLSYTTEKKSFTNYRFVNSLGDVTGKFKEEDQIVIYIYDNSSSIRTIYIDEDGNRLTTDIYKYGDIGDAYTTNKLYFDGYELIAVPTNYRGNYTINEQTIIYVYKKVNDPDDYGTGKTHPEVKDDVLPPHTGIDAPIHLTSLSAVVFLLGQFLKNKMFR